MYCYIIDPAHGMLTKNKHTPKFLDGSVYYEYEFTHSLAQKLAQNINAKGGQAVLTTYSPTNIGNTLDKRAKVANAFVSNLPKVFISIHSNLSYEPNLWQTHTGGAEVWIRKHSSFSRKLGSRILSAIENEHNLNNRGVKFKDNNPYYLFQHLDMPALVLECGYLNNSTEIDLLMDVGFHEALADNLSELLLS